MAGVSGVLGALIASDASGFARSAASVVLTQVSVASLGLVALVGGPLGTLQAIRDEEATVIAIDKKLRWLRAHLNPATKMVVLFGTESPSMVYFTPFMLGHPSPVEWRALTFQAGAIHIRRRGRVLEVSTDRRAVVAPSAVRFFRGSMGFREGEVFGEDGMLVTITKVNAMREAQDVRIVLGRDVDDPAVQWFFDASAGLSAVRVPRDGDTITLL
jgi:hypothetical protein